MIVAIAANLRRKRPRNGLETLHAFPPLIFPEEEEFHLGEDILAAKQPTATRCCSGVAPIVPSFVLISEEEKIYLGEWVFVRDCGSLVSVHVCLYRTANGLKHRKSIFFSLSFQLI